MNTVDEVGGRLYFLYKHALNWFNLALISMCEFMLGCRR